ncbi:hypothetical protein [Cochleicola gelatinilyticus]|uniref:HNH nuclease domain-containing protein n=1 Tax=Cochleicola gelatinilyticus TaxID=1763537 RepID=A0A167KFS8_9FLAO|nr:hypothetical protein [Cochleicola gelatinilyticus]OAB81846.1 hypothetical protein ULVI_00485 [Cochleicola gelatinilyticus]
MISLRECCGNIEEIEKEHTSFIILQIEPIVDFYIELFQLIEVFTLKTKNNKIIESVKHIGYLSAGKKKSLLQPLFKKKDFIKTISDYKNVKFDNKLTFERRMIPGILNSLNILKEDLKDILAMKVYDDSYYKVRLKKIYFILLDDISFLFTKIFNYKWFISQGPDTPWNAYKLTSRLGINICPYCNRQYTFTVSSSNSHTTRPELDHFLHKGENPLFALSFYNLIPSCTVCNRDLKGSIPFEANTHFSPYDENPKHGFLNYNYKPLTYDGSVGLTDEIIIELEINDPSKTILTKKLQSNIDVFKYEDIAIHHRDVAQEIIRKRYFSEDNYIQILQDTFPEANLSLEEAYRYAYGNFYAEKDFAKRPLAKLTKDIAINVGSVHQYNTE